MLPLSVCLIVRDEASVLARCLESVAGVATQIIVADTGSTDDTRRVAAAFGAQVLDVPWDDDFSAARNQALEAATAEWSMMLDADEWLPERSLAAMRQILPQVPTDAVVLGRRIAYDHGLTSFGPLIWPTAMGLRYRGRIHEVLDYAHVPNLAEAPDIVVVNQRPGWDDLMARDRAAWYRRLLAVELAQPEPSVEVLQAAGSLALAAQDLVQASACFERALAHPACFGARKAMVGLRLAEVRLAQGDEAGAVAEVVRICETRPEYLDAQVVAAQQAERQCRWSDARRHWSMALRLLRFDRPQYLQRLQASAGDMLKGYARALEGLGDRDGAAACVTAAEASDGDLTLLDELARRLPVDPAAAWVWYGELFGSPEWRDDGRPHAGDPVDLALVYTTVAEFLMRRLGASPDPVPLLEQAARRRPEDARPAEALARVLAGQWRWQEAWHWINEAFDRGGGSPALEVNRGLIAQRLGQFADARAAFERAAADAGCRDEAERLLAALPQGTGP